MPMLCINIDKNRVKSEKVIAPDIVQIAPQIHSTIFLHLALCSRADFVNLLTSPCPLASTCVLGRKGPLASTCLLGRKGW